MKRAIHDIESSRRGASVLAALLWIASIGCHEIDRVTPDPQVPGGPVRIEGRGFGDEQGASEVIHAGESIPVDSWSDGLIEARLSQLPLPGTYQVSVIVDGRSRSVLHTIPDIDTQCDLFYTLLAPEVKAELTAVRDGGETWCGQTGGGPEVAVCALLRHNDEDNPRNRNQTAYSFPSMVTGPESSCRVSIEADGPYGVRFSQYVSPDATEIRSFTVTPD